MRNVTSDLSVVIQAGGRSSRMGENKKTMLFQGIPLVQRVYERINKISDEILVVSNSPEELDFLNCRIFPDIIPNIGPIGGMYTAMEIASHNYVAVVACDLPFVNKEILLEAKKILMKNGADVAIPKTGPDYYEPLHAVYRRNTCKDAIEQSIKDKEYRLVSWLSKVKVIEMNDLLISKLDPGHLAFININTKNDFEQAEKIASGLK